MSLPHNVIMLQHANSFDTSAIGYAVVKSPVYMAFEQSMAEAPSLFADLLAVYPNATPAGKLYLAQVIQSVNPEAGERLLRQLAQDSTPIFERSGCSMVQMPVSAIAKGLLTPAKMLKPQRKPLPVIATAALGGCLLTLLSTLHIQSDSTLRIYAGKCDNSKPVPQCKDFETTLSGAGWPWVFVYRPEKSQLSLKQQWSDILNGYNGPFKASAFALNWCIYSAGLFGLLYFAHRWRR
jgi:hypothetical protein